MINKFLTYIILWYILVSHWLNGSRLKNPKQIISTSDRALRGVGYEPETRADWNRSV